MPKTKVALCLLFIPLILLRAAHPSAALSSPNTDFDVYYVAAQIAAHPGGTAIYNGADNGTDPQTLHADPNSLFGSVAHKNGIPDVMFYLYPPILADLLIPIGLLPWHVAKMLWTSINYGMLLLIAIFLAKILDLRLRSIGFLIILAGTLFYTPIVFGVNLGQITVVLLFLWASGVYFYRREQYFLAGLAFALAAAIKLTPLVIIGPILFWRDWKLVRSFTVACLFLGFATLIINSPGALTDYFFHVVPSMSRGLPQIENLSLAPSLQRVYLQLHGAGIGSNVLPSIPGWVVSTGKILSVAIYGLAMIPIVRFGSRMPMRERVIVLSLFAALSVVLSPVSWRHAFAMCYLPLALLWAESLRTRISNLRLIVLFLCTAALTTHAVVVAKDVLGRWPGYGLFASLLLITVPIAGIVLVFVRLSSIDIQLEVPR